LSFINEGGIIGFKQEIHRSQKTIFGYSVDDFVSKDLSGR